ncbi:MAG: STAS domain-containing protein [Planctomycetota bacterium]
MDVHVEQSETYVLLRPVGDVDLSTSRELQVSIKDLMRAKPSRVVVDLCEVPYMDSSGVATLVEGMQIARKQSTDLVLAGMQDKVRSIFEIARLDRVFRIVDTVDEVSAG